MLFALGYIAGLSTAVVIFSVLAFFRGSLERKIRIVQEKIESAGPRPKGYVFEPEDEVELARREAIRKNAEQGKDTRIEELL